MPSGSKKRKAAKKKKENQPNSHQDPSSQSHGSDDVRQQDGKESDVTDVGEVSSPMASQDPHNHQNPSAEGKEELIHDEKIVPTDVGANIEAVDKSVIVVEQVNVVSAKREDGIEDDSRKQDVRDGGSSRSSSSSSSSSSDDESHGMKSSQAVEDIAPVVDSVTVTHSLPESKVETSNSVAVEDTCDSDLQNVTVVQDKVSSLEEKVEVDINSVALSPVNSIVEETGEEKTSSFEDKVVISITAQDTVLELKEEPTVQSVEKISTISDTKEECVLQTDDQLIVSYNDPVSIAENGANNAVDSGVTEHVVRTALCPVQTTSWKSCCGLFEVFAGSRA